MSELMEEQTVGVSVGRQQNFLQGSEGKGSFSIQQPSAGGQSVHATYGDPDSRHMMGGRSTGLPGGARFEGSHQQRHSRSRMSLASSHAVPLGASVTAEGRGRNGPKRAGSIWSRREGGTEEGTGGPAALGAISLGNLVDMQPYHPVAVPAQDHTGASQNILGVSEVGGSFIGGRGQIKTEGTRDFEVDLLRARHAPMGDVQRVLEDPSRGHAPTFPSPVCPNVTADSGASNSMAGGGTSAADFQDGDEGGSVSSPTSADRDLRETLRRERKVLRQLLQSSSGGR